MSKAYVIELGKDGKTRTATWRNPAEVDLMDGNVTVRVHHTTMNYKDALAITGKSPVVRRYPMIPGIDFAGEVTASDDPRFSVGDSVILNGWGVGETHLGGYSPIARISGDWLLHQPKGLSGAECMAIGTAGYTAALCVLRLQDLGIGPDRGKVLVTGASGGVGSFAVSLLAALGYDVVASTGRLEESDYLIKLGATEVIDRREFSEPGRPLGKERFAGAIDAVGGQTLANVLSQIAYGGVVAACGLAQSHDLPTTVMPFILRSVTLAGVDSVKAERSIRERAWALLTERLDRAALVAITQTAQLEAIETIAPMLLDGRIRGRLVFDVS